MKSCAFFGHGKFDYREYKEEIEKSIIHLIENYSVTQFYAGGRGTFDGICSEIVAELKLSYPHIKNTLVLSYMPKEDFFLHPKYDDSVYLLEKQVPPKYAVVHTNKALIDKVDFVIVGVRYSWGGARIAYEYAEKRGKIFKNIFDVER